MRRPARALLVLLACAVAEAGRAAPGSGAASDPPAAPAETATPAAGPAGQPCGAQAARYADGAGFDLVVARAGQVRIENPLRPLTPEVNQIVQVVIAGKVATAYGPDFAALRRGGAPAAVEALLGGPIRWQAALPALPDPIAIVAEDGAPLAQLSFRACEAPPAVKGAPQPQARTTKPRTPKAAARKAAPGVSLPQGAIAE